MVLTLEIRKTNFKGITAKLWLAFSLHLPGIVFTVVSLAKITQWDLSSYTLFILQYWYIPLVPLISMVSLTTKSGVPLYQYILLGTPLLMIIYYLLGLLISERIKIRQRS